MPDSHEEYPIKLFGKIGSRQFESILSTHFKQSLSKSKIAFDLSNLSFIGTFETSQLLSWIYRLSSKKSKTVRIFPPGYSGISHELKPVLGYFGSWSVWDAFKKVGATVEGPFSAMSERQGSGWSEFSKKYVPFQFYAQKSDYESFLDGLADENNLNTIFEESAKLNVIGSGGLKNIILEEICKNSFEHGDSQAAHIAIGIRAGIKGNDADEVHKKLEDRLLAVPDYAVSFYRQLGTSDCIEIVVSDCGPGIPFKIKKAYTLDRIITNKKSKPTSKDLIEYAFLLHSTSKKDSWYYPPTNDNDENKYNLPRGLFFVKNIARRNKALLVCRSGDGIASWDFLSSSKGFFSRANVKRKGGKDLPLAHLGGTQIQILIPTNGKEDKRSASISIPTFIAGTTTDPKMECFAIGQKLKHARTARDSRHVVTEIHKFVQNNQNCDILVLDFIGTHWTKDALFPVVCEIGHIGLDGQIVATLHTRQFDAVLDEMWGDDIQDAFKGTFVHSLRPMLRMNFIGKQLKVDLPGIRTIARDTITENHIQDLLNGKNIASIPEILDCLFTEGQGKPLLRIDVKHLQEAINKWRKDILTKMLIDPTFGILHTGKFLLPTGPYVEGFYEIAAFFDHPDSKELLKEALCEKYSNFHRKDSTLVCISKVGAMVGALLTQSSPYQNETIKIVIENPLHIGFTSLGNPPFKQIIVVIDAVASGNTIDLILTMLSKRCKDTEIKILAVLDIREERWPSNEITANDRKYPLISIFRKPSLFYPTKPHSWRYEELTRIDPVDWRPIFQQEVGRQLWPTENFIKETCVKSNALEMGHFITTNGEHFHFFFVTRRIVKAFRDSIVKDIKEVIQDILDKEIDSRLTHILYPKESVGIDDVASALSVHFGGVTLIPVDRGGNPQTYRIPTVKVDTVVGLDNACSSGGTFQYLLDVAAVIGAKRMPFFVLMSRAPEETWRFVSQITGYDGKEIAVHALTRIPLPAYPSAAGCPICIRIKALESLSNSRRYSLLYKSIKRELRRLQSTEIGQFLMDNQDSPGKDLSNTVAFRVDLERQQSDTGALSRLESAINLPEKNGFELKISILEACADEAFNILGPDSSLPPDMKNAIGKMAIKIAEAATTPDLHRMACQSIIASVPHLIGEAMSTLIIRYSNNLPIIEAILLEMVLFAEISNSETQSYLSSKLEEIHEQVQIQAHHKSVHSDSLTLLSGVRRGMDRIKKSRLADQASLLTNVLEIRKICRLRKGTKHAYLGECLTRLSMISSPADVLPVTDKYYYEKDSLADILFGDILPKLKACRGMFETIGTVDYLLSNSSPCFEDDINSLDTTLNMIPNTSPFGRSSVDQFVHLFLSEDARAVRQRIVEWIGNEESKLLKLLDDCICDIAPVIRTICEQWSERLGKHGIIIEPIIPTGIFNVFIWQPSLESILMSTLQNCHDHAFRDIKVKKPIVQVELISDGNTVSIIVSDNGKGLPPSSDGGIARVNEIVNAFGGSAGSDHNNVFNHIVHLKLQATGGL